MVIKNRQFVSDDLFLRGRKRDTNIYKERGRERERETQWKCSLGVQKADWSVGTLTTERPKASVSRHLQPRR